MDFAHNYEDKFCFYITYQLCRRCVAPTAHSCMPSPPHILARRGRRASCLLAAKVGQGGEQSWHRSCFLEKSKGCAFFILTYWLSLRTPVGCSSSPPTVGCAFAPLQSDALFRFLWRIHVFTPAVDIGGWGGYGGRKPSQNFSMAAIIDVRRRYFSLKNTASLWAASLPPSSIPMHSIDFAMCGYLFLLAPPSAILFSTSVYSESSSSA